MKRCRQHTFRKSIAILGLMAMPGVVPPSAEGTIIADISHLKGRRENHLMGYGLVVGLSGTGDGGKYAASIRQLQAMLEKFAVPVTQAELADTKNVAIVWVEATLPENGIREGDTVDVQVSSVGSAKSLIGGRLVATPLEGPGLQRIYAFAQGPVRVLRPKQKTTGLITNGATMEQDVIHHYIDDAGRITLVLEDVHASYALASVIAQSINEDQSEVGQVRQVARALDPKNVIVKIPAEYIDRSADFIGRIENLELLLPESEGRIVINRRTQTIAIGSGVQIGPAIIAHGGMTIRTTTPPVQPTSENPRVDDQHVVKIGSPQRGGAKLQELVDKLNQLNVPAKDIIEIIENLHRTGKIHGKLVYKE